MLPGKALGDVATFLFILPLTILHAVVRKDNTEEIN